MDRAVKEELAPVVEGWLRNLWGQQTDGWAPGTVARHQC